MQLASRLLLVLIAISGLFVASPVLADADLQVFKADAVDPTGPGSTQTYTITVINNGPDDAEFATLIDTLPAGTTFLSLTPSAGWTCTTPAVGSGGDVDCSTDSMAAFSAATFTLQVVFDDNLQDGTVVTNAATAGFGNPRGEPGRRDRHPPAPRSASLTDADLSVSKSGTPEPVLPGDNLTYTITVNNAGPADAATMTLDDPLPAGTTFQSLDAPVDWICTTPAVGDNGTVSCSIPTLAPGSAVFTLVVQVDASLPPGTVISNAATVTSPTQDPNPDNQNTSTLNTVGTPPAVAITATKTASGDFGPGGSVVYTIVLTNSGDANQANNPGDELTDVLPAQLILVGASAASGTTTAVVATNTVTWNGAIPAGGSVTITIQATIRPDVADGTVIANQASLAFDANVDGTNESQGLSDDPDEPVSGDATTFVVSAGSIEVPTLDVLGRLLLIALLALGGAGLLWWRRA